MQNLDGNVTGNSFIGNIGRWRAGRLHVEEKLTGNVTHNTFTNNTSDADSYEGGGGFGAKYLTGNVTHNIFNSNSCKGYGGGFFVHQRLIGDITHNTFNSNKSGARNQGHGGGFAVTYQFTGNVTHNIFDGNSTGADSRYQSHGSGFYFRDATRTVEVNNNIFFNNTAVPKSNSAVYTEAVVHLWRQRQAR